MDLLNDIPSCDINELPSRKHINQELQKLILKSAPPLVIGVHGDWGAGKTSFLHQLQFGLTGKCDQNPAPPSVSGLEKYATNVIAVWFEAWRYQYEAAPVVALLHEIRERLASPQNLVERLQLYKGETAKLGEVSIRGALLSIEGLTKHIGFQASKIQEAGEKWESEHYATPIPTKVIRDQLEQAIKNLLPQKKGGASSATPRLVVFIDDLDRCEPEMAFRLLEGIKIYLNLENCVFILGLNRREIERAIAKCLPSLKTDAETGEEIKIRAQEYLEKLCNNLWPLARLTSKDEQILLKKWLPTVGAEDVAVKMAAMLGQHAFLPPNPRRIKMFCNAFGRLLSELRFHRIDLTKNNYLVLAIVFACLQQFHPRLYALVEQEPAFLIELREFAISEGESVNADLKNIVRPFVLKKDDATNLYVKTFRHTDTAYGDVLHCQSLLASVEIKESEIKSLLAFN